MNIINKNSSLIYFLYFILITGFLGKQVFHFFLLGIKGTPYSIYISQLNGISDILVTTEPVYFFIAKALQITGIPAFLVLTIISQTIFASLLYLFLKIGQNFSQKQQIAIIIMASFSFIFISFSESIIRQGVGIFFFTMFLFSNQQKKWIYILLAIFSHNIFGVIGYFYLLIEAIFRTKSKNQLFIFLLFLLVSCIFVKDFLLIISELTSRASYIEYFTSESNFRYDFLFVMILYNASLVIIKLYLKNKNKNKNKNTKLIVQKLLILGISAVLLQLSFLGMPYFDRVIYIPLVYMPIILAILFSKPKYILFLVTLGWVVVNLFYMSL